MVCFLIVGLMAVSGTFPAMAADDPTWPSLQQSQAEFPAAQDTDVNTDMGIVMAENVKIPSKVKRLVRKYTKEKGKTIYFASPFCQVVRNRSVQLTINKEAAGVTYKSSKPKVARVSKKGVLSTYKRGYTVITATWKKKTCHMVVYVIPSRGAREIQNHFCEEHQECRKSEKPGVFFQKEENNPACREFFRRSVAVRFPGVFGL